METQANGAALVRAEPQAEPQAVEIHGSRVADMRQVLSEETAMRAMVREYVQRHMIKDTDFGTIPGTPKPTLLKPGAEKLVDLFRASPKFTLIKSEEDFDRGHGFFNYIFRVRLVSRSNGELLAEGFGSANSREGRYRWRNSNRKCPKCGKETIIKGKEEFGGGWVCWQKGGGGCKAKWPAGAKEIEGQTAGKVENEDVATLANTVLKMAKKRALVDGAIALARCSDLFTQDVEDFADAHEPPPTHEVTPSHPEPQAQPIKTSPVAAPRTDSGRVAHFEEPKKQRPVDRLGAEVAKRGLDSGAVNAAIRHVKKLGAHQRINWNQITDEDVASVLIQFPEPPDQAA